MRTLYKFKIKSFDNEYNDSIGEQHYTAKLRT